MAKAKATAKPRKVSLSDVKEMIEAESSPEIDAILASMEEDFQAIELGIAELEKALQERTLAERFISRLEHEWENVCNKPGTRAYEIIKELKSLEKAMDGKEPAVNTALEISKVPSAHPLWSELGALQYQQRALKRNFAMQLGKIMGISPEKCSEIIETERKARQASRINKSEGTPKGGTK